jgi:hypothetical protein
MPTPDKHAHITVTGGNLHTEHETFAQAQQVAAHLNKEAEKLGLKARYEAHDAPRVAP